MENNDLRPVRRGRGVPALVGLLATLAALTLGCDVEAPNPTPGMEAPVEWLTLGAACDDLLPADGAARPLVVHHPDLRPGTLWWLRLHSPDGAGKLVKVGDAGRALLSNVRAQTSLEVVCHKPGRLQFTLLDDAEAVLAEALVVCMAPHDLPAGCGGPTQPDDLGLAPPDPEPQDWGAPADPPSWPAQPDAEPPPDEPDPDPVDPALRVRLFVTEEVALSWPDAPVDGAAPVVELAVQVTRQGGRPVEGAALSTPPRAPPAPFWVEAPDLTDADGRATIRLHPRPYRGRGQLRVVASIVEGLWSAPSVALRVVTVSAPAAYLTLACDQPHTPALADRRPDGTYGLNPGGAQDCLVRTLDRTGHPSPGGLVSLHAEAGTVPPRVRTDAAGIARFQWRSEGPGPYSPHDQAGPQAAAVTLMAATLGEEPFRNWDQDPGDFNPPTDTHTDAQDYAEPFLDLNGDGQRSTGLAPRVAGGAPVDEPYLDGDGDRRYDGPNGEWDADAQVWTSLEVVWRGPPDAASVLRPFAPRCADGRRLLRPSGFATATEFELTAADMNGLCPHGTAYLEPLGGGAIRRHADVFDLSDLCDDALRARPVRFWLSDDGARPDGLRVVLDAGLPGVEPVVHEVWYCD
ncbi:MAG: hypothetical protein KC613_24005 [Myxococcales bacterium]|nr:hypothetical protein [Myxococcales bacterium]